MLLIAFTIGASLVFAEDKGVARLRRAVRLRLVTLLLSLAQNVILSGFVVQRKLLVKVFTRN